MESADSTPKAKMRNLPDHEVAQLSRLRWVYGYWLKNKMIHRLARHLKLNWRKNPSSTLSKVMDHIERTSRVDFDTQDVLINGKGYMILVFVRNDERKSDGNEFSEKQIDAVRRAMGLPKGTKPRWFEIYGRARDLDAGPDSEDEPFPYAKPPPSMYETQKPTEAKLREMEERVRAIGGTFVPSTSLARTRNVKMLNFDPNLSCRRKGNKSL